MHPELLVRKRIWLMTLVLTGLFLLAAARIAVLTTSEAASLTERGIRQWTKAGIVTARRGTITDRKGRTLAISATAYIVTADPRLVSDTERFLDSIEPVLNINKETARKRLQDKTKGSIILKRQVSRETVDALRQLRSDAPEDSGLKALSFDEDICRYYPYGALLSQVLGLTTVDSEGQSGLESRYEDVLRGTEGSYLRQVDARNRQLDGTEGWYIPSQQGCGLVLTIDAEIQEMVEKAMRECIEVNQAQSVICLASDVKTGAILAMCMNPCYDPNDPPRNDAETLTELMRLTAISDVYEPGSTFKILTAASALDSGVTTPQDSFYCSAKITVDGDTIRCWGRPHGAETMADGLKNSCNPVFVELALRMGTDTFYRYLTAFGLGKKTGIDLPGESPGILITSRNVKRVDLARIGFGQSVALTPIQMIMAAPIRPETSDTMRLLLERVVSEGGGKNAAIAGYRIGGKTGTAQVYKNGRVVRDTHIGSFYGFAPVNDPQVSILVIVKEADVPIDYGGTTAAPFARQIMQEMLPYLGIDPENDEKDEEIEVPALKGLTIGDAKRKLSQVGLESVTDGANTVVLDQLPPAGAKLVKGGHVMLYTAGSEEMTPEELVCVPDLTGLGDVDCARLVRQRGLMMSMTGQGLCIEQSPAAGEYVQPGTTIFLLMAGDDE